MSNRITYAIGYSDGESFDFSRSNPNSVTNNKTYGIGGCSIGESFNFALSSSNSVSNSINYALTSCENGCFSGDSDIVLPSGSGNTIVGYDFYGSIGPSTIWNSSVQYPWVNQCDWIVYCDGPVDEAIAMTGYDDRYSTRWVAYIEAGYVYYGKVGGSMARVSDSLIAQPVTEKCLGFAFDANGRAVFAISDYSNATIYRYVDYVPTTYNFAGSCAKLFFNGVLYPDNSLWDVVCYYIDSNGLYARFQRENFAVPNLVADGGLASWKAIKAMAYSRYSPAYHYIAISNGPYSSILRCGPYPMWPETASDVVYASATFNSDLIYQPVIVEIGSYTETATTSAGFNSDIIYQSLTVNVSSSDSATATAGFDSNVSYEQSIVLGGSYSESATSVASINSDIHYYQSIVGTLTETESATASASFNSDIDYTV